MPFRRLDPPSTRPRGRCNRQPAGRARMRDRVIGPVLGGQPQLVHPRRLVDRRLSSGPPASKSRTATSRSTSRRASAQPAEPAPTTITSATKPASDPIPAPPIRTTHPARQRMLKRRLSTPTPFRVAGRTPAGRSMPSTSRPVLQHTITKDASRPRGRSQPKEENDVVDT